MTQPKIKVKIKPGHFLTGHGKAVSEEVQRMLESDVTKE